MAFRPAKYIKHKTGELPVKEGKLFYEFNGQQLWEGDARNLHFIPDESVQLIVTSPPYNVAMDYGDWHDVLSVDDYLEFTEQWLKEAYRVLCVGGRLAVNVPACLTQSTGSKIAFVAMDIWNIAIKKIGFLPRDWICWNKPYLLQGITSWGSWLSQSSPFCRDKVEYIIVFSKKDYKLDPRGKQSDLTKDEFLRLSKNLWTMAPENRKLHPAPFPLELPLRVIKFYCFPEDVVLDPFVGSGTTLLACKLLNRKGIGVDYNPDYLKIAKERIAQQTLPLKDVILTKFKFIEDEDYLDKLEYTQLELFNVEK
jgi:site-specific DNA-methyltransferase (adenine-specific)